MFRVDDPCSEPRFLHEERESGERRAESGEWRAESGERRAESGERRAESDIAIRLVYENDYIEISAKAVSAKRKLNRFALPLLYRANRTAGKSLTH